MISLRQIINYKEKNSFYIFFPTSLIITKCLMLEGDMLPVAMICSVGVFEKLSN